MPSSSRIAPGPERLLKPDERSLVKARILRGELLRPYFDTLLLPPRYLGSQPVTRKRFVTH